MRKPKMILFDYGQALINEKAFDGVAGTKAVLRYATKNKYSHTAEEVQAAADAINQELGRFDPARRHLFQLEVPNHMFTAFLYQSMGIALSLTPPEIDQVFWDAASPGAPTEGIEDFLRYLKEQNIRTGGSATSPIAVKLWRNGSTACSHSIALNSSSPPASICSESPTSGFLGWLWKKRNYRRRMFGISEITTNAMWLAQGMSGCFLCGTSTRSLIPNVGRMY